MSLQSATERPQGAFPRWLRITLPCMFLALALIRMLDNGIMKPGWMADLCIAIAFLIFVPRIRQEPRRTYFKQPRMLAVLLLFGIAIVLATLDLRHLFLTNR
jgi:hypothetical protein